MGGLVEALEAIAPAVVPPPVSGLGAWFGLASAVAQTKDGPKAARPHRHPVAFAPAVISLTNRHAHWTCWQCEAEVICQSVYGYTCDNCDVQQSAMSNCKPDPLFDYDAAAAWLNP